MGFSTLDKAVKQAVKSAKNSGEERFVVFESGEFHIASAVDLDTFFMGLSDNQIKFSTADDYAN